MPETKKNGAKKVSKTSSSKTTKDSKESSHQSFSFKTFTSSLQKRWKKTSQGTKIFAVSALLILVVSFVGFLGFQGGNQDADQASASNREIVSKICPDGFTNMDQDGVCVAEQQDPTYGSGDFQFGCIAGNPAGYSTVGAAGVYFCNSPAQLKLLANSEIAGKLSVSTTCQPSAPSGFSSIGGTNIDCGNDSSNTGFWMYATSDIASNFSLQKTCQPSAPSGFSSAGGINIDCGNSSNNLGLHLFVRSSFSVDSGTPQLQANGCPVGYILNTFTRCIETVPAVCPDGYVENGGQCYEEFECPEGGEVQGNLCVATQTSEITAAAECFAGGTLQGDGQTCRIDNGFNSPSGIGNCSAGDIFFISDEYVCGNIVPHSFSLGGQSSCSFPPPGTAYGNYVSSCGYYGGVIQNAGSCGGDSKGSRARCASPRTRYFLDYKGTLRLSDFSYDAIQITDPTGGQAVSLQCPTDFPISAIPGRCTSNNADNVAPQTGGSNTASTAPGICPTPTTFTNIPYQELNATQCYRDLPDGSNQGGDSGYGNCEYGESNYGNNNCPDNGGGSNTTNFADGQVSINKDVPDTVTAGSEVTERIYFDNTASESADSTNITSSIPNGFTLVGGSTKVCLDPEGTDGGAVCTGSSNDFPAIDEGAVWNGGTLSIAPSAGLYGNGSIGTGDLEFGRARYGYIQRNDSCDNSNFAYYSVLEFGNNSSVPFGLRAGCPNGNVEALSFLGQRYAYVQRNENCDGGSFAYHGVQSFGNSPSAPFGLRAGCAAGDVVVRDTVGHRYAYVQRNENCDGGNFAYHGMLEFGNSPSAPFGLRAGCAAGDVAVRDTLDTSNGRGYIEFKMKAPSTNGTFNQSASMNSPEFSEVTDSATITVTGGSGGGDTTTFADGQVSINKDVPDTVTAGSEVTERIYFDNTASESADSTNITSSIPNGFTLVGGSTYYGTSCYNTNTTGWRIATPSVPTTMNYGIGGQIGNKVYIVDSSPNNLYVWERNTNQWSTAATPPKDFTGAGSAVVNGKLYIYGNRNTGTGDLHVYDPTTNTWEQKAGRTSVTWTNSYSVIGDDIYVLGGVWGDVFKKYETDTDTWVDLAGRPRSSEDEHSTLVPYNGKLYSFGGNDGFDSNRPASRSHPYIYEYTPSTDSWTTLNTTAPVNTSGQVATVYNGKIYLAGGFSASDKKVYSFDPVTGLYTDLNLEMPESAYMAVDARFGDQWYIFGNESPSNAPSTKVLTLPDQRVQLNNSVWNGNSITLSPQGVQGSGDLEANSCGYIEFKMKAPSTNGTFNQSASMNSPEFSEVTDSATITVTGGSGGGDTTNDGPNDANIDETESNNGNDTNNDGLIDGLENITPDGSGGVDGQTATTGQPTACTDLSNTGCVVDAQGNPNSNFNDNDIDGDGIPNSQDTDMDGDGFNNWFDTDTDQDGINNEFDNDDDNDGIPDDQDDTPQGPGSGDNDGDDIPDGIDADIDGDGDNNGNDLDGDGIIDTDSDGNATGCDDLSNQGCVVDDNGNPNSNYTDDDIDGDGIPNDQDNDIDGDGAPNQVDDDADQDGFTNDGSNPNGGSDNNGGNTTDGTPDTNDDNDNLTDIGNDPNQDGADTNGNDPTPQGPTSNDADIDNDNGNGNGGSNNANDGNGDGIIDGLEDSNSDGNGGQTGTPDYTNCQSTAGAATGSTAIGGTNSNPDCVTDNQGNPNDNYTDTDIDGDGIPNQQDTDMDGDGINNQDDNDVDQDGYNNDIDNDDDNDGIPDAQDPTPQGPVNANNANIDGTEANNGNDTNNDGVIDGLENSGSDGQGGIEGQTATNNIPTPCNESQAGCVVDSDGVPNSNYTDNDIDGDGIPNDQDDDMDGDGVLNTVDNDIDQDGYNNEFDLDDDNDGILDTDDDTQSGTTDNNDADVDDDGELNGNDTNNDDIIDGLENSTGDGNGGIANQNPSTGDNMPTACNASDPNCVINSDGTPNDNFDESDIDGDNIPNTQDTDLDGDGVPNWLDNDADQDGYNNDNDLDDDNDGIPDDQDDTPQGPGSGNNDGDNQVDGIDADVDDDGANNGNDLDGDGVIDTDANGNPTGCSDASNPDCVVDGDGVPVTDGNGDNNVDPDIDGDGIPNEDDYDMDGDGSPNTDDDDTDQDGFTNDVDLDDDNDGILDVNDPTPQGPVDPTDADIDNDGLNNGNDTNDDGIIDGLEDAISDGNGGVTDSNGNPITPTPCDPAVDTGCVTDENGIPTDQFQDGDIDGDGTPNTSDTDIDGDGVPNNQDNDVDQDGYNNDVDLDDDNDGILDVNDPTPQGPGSGNNVNAFGIPDCYIYETNPLNGEIFRDANGDPVPSRPCFLFEAFDANDDGDYYFTPEKTNNPIYKEDVTMELFLKNDQVPACQNASAIDITIRTRPVTESNNESAWQDITDTNVSQSNFIAQAEIPLSFRYPGVNIETATKWEFQIDLECDETHYRAEPNYFFATGALALVQVTGTVID